MLPKYLWTPSLRRRFPAWPLGLNSMTAATESKLRRGGIPFEYISKRRPERIEPWVEVAPLVQAFAEDGFADLFRTRSPHGALVLVELENSLFIWQAAVA